MGASVGADGGGRLQAGQEGGGRSGETEGRGRKDGEPDINRLRSLSSSCKNVPAPGLPFL